MEQASKQAKEEEVGDYQLIIGQLFRLKLKLYRMNDESAISLVFDEKKTIFFFLLSQINLIYFR